MPPASTTSTSVEHDGAEADDAEEESRQERYPPQVGPRLVDDGYPELERPVCELRHREQGAGHQRCPRIERVGLEPEDRDVLGAEERDGRRNRHREAQDESRGEQDESNDCEEDVHAGEVPVLRQHGEPGAGTRPDEHGRSARDYARTSRACLRNALTPSRTPSSGCSSLQVATATPRRS